MFPQACGLLRWLPSFTAGIAPPCVADVKANGNVHLVPDDLRKQNLGHRTSGLFALQPSSSLSQPVVRHCTPSLILPNVKLRQLLPRHALDIVSTRTRILCFFFVCASYPRSPACSIGHPSTIPVVTLSGSPNTSYHHFSAR
ncbi:hypothetical protein B0T14DRAFT_525063 [Immersiella caudata]|uniref:Secreted protein n=1 Tax=Immersiella caudata TaxID=314043 RepID=A0AA39WL51_9PEZI|nr:hypothetical protein B0T14DRAFT_525063 [Immersiella caudata]